MLILLGVQEIVISLLVVRIFSCCLLPLFSLSSEVNRYCSCPNSPKYTLAATEVRKIFM